MGEDAAAGEADDVVEEAQRSMHRAVLVVDHAVGMPAVGREDQLRGGGQILVAPGAQFQPDGQMHARRSEVAIERAPHQEPPVVLEARIEEDAGVGAGGVQQQLRFDAIHLRRVHQQLKKVAQQRLLDLVR